MIKIMLSGCNGRMGQVVTRLCADSDLYKIVAGIDSHTVKLNDYPVYADPLEFTGKPDVIIDFSKPEALPGLAGFAVKNKVPLVIAATGHDAEHEKLIAKAAVDIPVFKSANMSLGINLISALVKKAAAILGDGFEVEIIERHHNQKVDAPSGTAIMLYNSVASALPYQAEQVYDRHDVRQKRGKREIGLHAVRGGTIVGEHEVMFAGHDEIIQISHSARSREVFAAGALKAASFVMTVKEPGFYDMNSLVETL